MSNVDASEENVESPSAYGGQAYIEYRKKEKKRRGKKK
jgi:predicted nucleotide-binding protein